MTAAESAPPIVDEAGDGGEVRGVAGKLAELPGDTSDLAAVTSFIHDRRR